MQRLREDYTQTTEPPERRLDTFARLLSSNSVCVGVSVINDTLVVSANDLFSGSREDNTTVTSIKKTIKYFQEVTNGQNHTNSEREAVFLNICSAKRITEIAQKATIDSNMQKEIIISVMKGEDPTVSNIIKKYGKDATIANMMYTEFRKLYEDFSKLEETFKKPNTRSEELNSAIKKLPIILKEEPTQSVHAEVQILSHIIQNIKNGNIKDEKEIYLGISKLCCLHCHEMLKAANSALQKQKPSIKLTVRGHHDLDFSWTPPHIFSKKYQEAENLSTAYKKSRDGKSTAGSSEMPQPTIIGELEDIIGHNSALSIIKMLEEKKPTGVSMAPSRSNSEAGQIVDERIDQELLERKSSLEQQLVSLTELKTKGIISEIDTISKALSIAITLHEIEQFKLLHKEDNIDKDGILRNFLVLMATLKAKQPSVPENHLLGILQDSHLVGEKVSGLFSKLSPSDLIKETDKKRKVDDRKDEDSQAIEDVKRRANKDVKVAKESGHGDLNQLRDQSQSKNATDNLRKNTTDVKKTSKKK